MKFKLELGSGPISNLFTEDGRHVARIYYNTPNVIEFEDKMYFIETPYSSLDQHYAIYELSNGQRLEADS